MEGDIPPDIEALIPLKEDNNPSICKILNIGIDWIPLEISNSSQLLISNAMAAIEGGSLTCIEGVPTIRISIFSSCV